MVVDFKVKRTPAYLVASIKRVGPWREDVWKKELSEIEKWAKKNRVRTGKVLLYELGGGKNRTWETCVEISRKIKSEGKIKVKKLEAETVASVHFNPKKVSPRLVYHGLSDWLTWRLKDKTFKKRGASREVYFGNPWKKAYAWARAEVQVLVKKR
jgi:effector-binding domain-containing protein